MLTDAAGYTNPGPALEARTKREVTPEIPVQRKNRIERLYANRAFKRASKKDLDAINHADLSAYKFVGLMIDGTGFGEKTILPLHKLGVTGQLRSSLSSTNIIESLIGVVKNKTGKVSNWSYHRKLKIKIPRDKVLRWVASSNQAHKAKMRKLRGVAQMPTLLSALNSLDQMKISA